MGWEAGTYALTFPKLTLVPFPTDPFPPSTPPSASASPATKSSKLGPASSRFAKDVEADADAGEEVEVAAEAR